MYKRQLPVSEVFISAKFGTGENLLKEDITRGFDDYIYVRKLIFDEDEMVELDTAQLDFSSEKMCIRDSFLTIWRKIILLIPLIFILPRILSGSALEVFLAEPIAEDVYKRQI